MLENNYNLRTILKFTLPVVLSELSRNLMFTINRIVLAHYSLDAMNAAAISGNFVLVASFALISVSQISTVFVGQYNGLKEFKKTARPAWQMIYLGLFAFVIYIPISLATEYICISPEYYRQDAIIYQKIMIAFAGLPAIICALSSFFIGRGQSFIIIAVVMIGNSVDFLLSILFVFGIPEIFQPMGVAGAATATVMSEITQICILFFLFLKKENRKTYNTFDFSFRKDLFLDCIKTGLPVSIGKILEMLAWFVMLLLFSYASKDLATIESIAVSLFVIFIFFADGCGRSISALSANLIGKNDIKEISSLLKIFMKLNAIMSAIFAIPLVFFHELIFLFLDSASGNIAALRPEFEFVFTSLWIIIFADGILYMISGILMAGGDTKFQMYLESLTAWVFVIFPMTIMYYTETLTSIRLIYTILPIRALINAFIIYRRYRAQKWIKKLV